MAQIIVQNVTKAYQVGAQTINAVSSVSLSVERGDFISIVGHSGSGKTTLLSLIGGITNPSSGSISFEDRDISSLTSDQLSEYRNEKIGFMFQFASLLPLLTVRENLLLPTLFSKGEPSREEPSSKAIDLIRMVGLADKIEAYPSQLSGGQQRRVAIARAFMNRPDVILADEPTGDLDEDTERDMMNFFLLMNRDAGITFIMVTHNSDLAKRSHRVIRMQQGSILGQ
ncbi:MAG: ABC transporter [Nitrospirae bacterium GWD2_57_9]|nr:MAG: ABC transporter [Nitrospirae bacterium GWD2_57_9]OGW48618.1 MAG: ABC transporter [Nitrospirae bacterium GWC2_57_9]